MQVIYCYLVPVIKGLWVVNALLLLTSLCTPAFGQSPLPADTVFLNVEKDLASQLLPFESLYELALSHSPAIKQENAVIESKIENIEYVKWTFLRGIGVASSVTRGNQALITNDNSPLLSLSNGYRVGLVANLSLGELINRRPVIRQAKSDHKAAIAKRDMVIQELRRDLYRLYQATLLSQRTLHFYVEEEQVALVAFQTAEIGWKENRLTAASYSAAARLYTESRTKVEQERVAVSTNLFDLITLIGVPMGQLQRLSR